MAVDDRFAEFMNSKISDDDDISEMHVEGEAADGDMVYSPSFPIDYPHAATEVQLDINEDISDDDDNEEEVTDAPQSSDSYFVSKDGTQQKNCSY